MYLYKIIERFFSFLVISVIKTQSQLFLPKCSYTEFQCKNGQCIDANLWCDGTFHCKDLTDENKEYCRDK